MTNTSRFRLVFALENSFCNDCATENLSGPLLHGVVGAPNVADLVPDKDAIINLLDFADSRAAAVYLQVMLDDPAAMYGKQQPWRKRPYTGAFAGLLFRTSTGIFTAIQERTRAGEPTDAEVMLKCVLSQWTRALTL